MPNSPYSPPAQFTSSLSQNAQWAALESSNETYYSGLDASIYLTVNGVSLYMGEVVTLQYELQEQVMPVYRYSDYTFSKAIHGARIAYGQFTINFQQTFLIYMILEYLRGLRAGSDSVSAQPKNLLDAVVQIATTAISAINPATPNPNSGLISTMVNTAIAALSPENNTVALPSQQILQSRTQSSQKKLISSVNSIVSNNSASTSFDQIIAQNKVAQNWVQSSSTAAAITTPAGSLLARTRDSITPFFSKFDVQRGFDMNIVFGNLSQNDYLNSYQVPTPDGSYVPQSFESTYQGMASGLVSNNIENALASTPPFTVRTIQGIEITGFGQAIDDSGRPILETYNFLAKDIV